VSKKKPAKKKGAAASRRKVSKRSSSRGRSKAASAPPPRKIQLKPIKVLVERALVDLRRLPPTEAIDITIKHLESCSMALSDICNPATPGGCGDTMEFDFPLALTTSRG
jgi:hypothetical protein